MTENIPPNGGKIAKRKRGRPREETSGRALAELARISLRQAERQRTVLRLLHAADDWAAYDRIRAFVMTNGNGGRLRIGMQEKMARLPVDLRHGALDLMEQKGWSARDAYDWAVFVWLDRSEEAST
jgi:hypothetical protein